MKLAKLSNKYFKLKKCKYPGCNIVENMASKAKYCQEHRKKEYRKIIDCDKKISIKSKREQNKKWNQIINHEYIKAQTINIKCALPNCDNHFEIKLLHGINIYPKYCQDHRNEFQRNRFIQKDF